VIAGLRDLGKTVFLTTHYMDEAQRLADRVAIIVSGEIVARGAPEELGDRASQPATITYRLEGEEVSVQTETPVQTLNELTGWAIEQGVELEGLEVSRPSLEDVYLALTRQG
jgi:ABC-2 type transport system ATP-binding protein